MTNSHLLVPEAIGCGSVRAHGCAEVRCRSALSQAIQSWRGMKCTSVSVLAQRFTLTMRRDVESLMRHADVAMYKARRTKARIRLLSFQPSLVEIVEKRQKLLSRTTCQALDTWSFDGCLPAQNAQLKNNRVTSCEALVRWTKARWNSLFRQV